MADLAIAIKIATEDQSSGPIGRIKGALGGLGEMIAAPTRAIGGLVSGLGQLGLAAQGVQAVMGAAQGVGNLFGIGALNEMEQITAKFNAFTKDAGVTEQILADVRAEANKTPFAFGEMANSAAALQPVAKASGIALMDMLKEAEILAASNPLEGLEGASFALKEAMTGDFTSIIERFNLSRSSINQWKAEGVPNIEIVRRAMQEMGLDSDLIAAKAETLDGRWSTFQDTLVTLQMKMGQPIFDAMKEGLTGLQGAVDSSMPLLEGLAESVAGGLTSAIATGRAAIGTLLDAWNMVAASFEQGGIIGALRAVGPMLGSLLQNLGGIIVDGVEGWAASFAGWVGDATPGLLSNLGTMGLEINTWILESALSIVEKLGTWAGAFLDWIGPMIPDLLREMGSNISAVWGWIGGTALPLIVGKLAEWGLAFVAWIAPRIPPLLLELGKLLLDLGGWIIGTALPAIASKLAEWAGAFVEWVSPQIPPLLVELGRLSFQLGEWIATTALPAIIEKLGEWAAAFVDWLPPQISPLLEAAGRLLVDLGGWMATTALPAIVLKLTEWGAAFVDWVATDVLPILPEKLGAILTALTNWVGEKLTAFGDEAARLGVALLDGVWTADSWSRQWPTKLLELLTNLGSWVGEKLADFGNEAARLGVALLDGLWTAASWSSELPGKLGELLIETGTWITGKVGEFGEQAKSIGSGLLQGIQDGISGALDGFWGWLQTNFIDKIPESIRNILNLDADTGALAMVGERMVRELEIGIENRWPSLTELWGRLSGQLGEVGDSGGKVRSYIVEAAAERGIDPRAALAVARHEGGEDDYMRVGRFETGWSFWPFQLHYGGSGYEHFGTEAGMGNDFTRKTGLQPCDWRAWDESIDFALDRAKRHGWGAWYGREPAGIDEWEGINAYGEGGWITEPVVGVGLRSRQGYIFGERGEDELVTPRSRVGQAGGATYNVTVNGAGLEEIPGLVIRKLRQQELLKSVRRGG